MPRLSLGPLCSLAEPMTEILHGVPVIDPYRWLEDQNSDLTRTWIKRQTQCTRDYLDAIPQRKCIQDRVQEFLAIETYDSVQSAGNFCFFRKRAPDQQQFCIYMREAPDAQDQLLIDPILRGTGKHTAVRPIRPSPDGSLLLYEVKQGGEQTGTFEILDVTNRCTLSDALPRGRLRGFAFDASNTGFYYCHEPVCVRRPFDRAAYHHVFGEPTAQDREIFHAGEGKDLRLCLISDQQYLGFLVYRFGEKTKTSFYLSSLERDDAPEQILVDAEYHFGPLLVCGRILALTNRDAPNLRIVELCLSRKNPVAWSDVIPESDARVQEWAVAGEHIYVSYAQGSSMHVSIFDFAGKHLGELPVRNDETVHFLESSASRDELFVESQSFTDPIRILRYTAPNQAPTVWARRILPFDPSRFEHVRASYSSKDGTNVPMLLMGRPDILAGGTHPAVMTSYGGFGLPMTPQFSVLVAFLVERGCLFALPNIRGGSEFGAKWHEAAKRRNRQRAYDDFLCAAEWLVQTERTTPSKLAIFGGSNSGLLCAVAMTQRPDLFRAVVCMAPMLDMLRYHLFDESNIWRDEFGTADNPEDFGVLSRYSPYHHVEEGVPYPATMIVSGDRDQNCNPLHARKMTARLQAANISGRPILLDYNPFRGHSPVLPLSDRIEGLTDRLAFLCDQLQLDL